MSGRASNAAVNHAQHPHHDHPRRHQGFLTAVISLCWLDHPLLAFLRSPSARNISNTYERLSEENLPLSCLNLKSALENTAQPKAESIIKLVILAMSDLINGYVEFRRECASAKSDITSLQDKLAISNQRIKILETTIERQNSLATMGTLTSNQTAAWETAFLSLREEIKSLYGKPPTKFESLKKSGHPIEFLEKHYQRFRDDRPKVLKDQSIPVLFSDDLRKIDLTLLKSIENYCTRENKNIRDYLPREKDRTDLFVPTELSAILKDFPAHQTQALETIAKRTRRAAYSKY